MTSKKTIYALSTAPGKAGVAIIRLSGPNVIAILKQIIGEVPKPRYATLKTLYHPITKHQLDKALILYFPAPHSFTGEDVGELHIHGGKAVIESVLEAISHCEGTRLAEPGEFTKRGFLNAKLDLTEVEGLADLIEAQTEAQRQQALLQASGVHSQLYESWRSQLLKALALLEAELDFADEADVLESVTSEKDKIVKESVKSIKRHLSDHHRGEILREGFRVVIAGPPNAGKSSLLNRLAQRDAAIVSEEAGTTRDSIEVYLNLNGYPVIVTDTAGIRKTTSQIEQEGIRRSLSHISKANLIIWLEDSTKFENLEAISKQDIASLSSEDREKTLIVFNKSDLRTLEIGDIHQAQFKISVKTGEGLEALIGEITNRAQSIMGSQEAPTVTRARHREQLQTCVVALEAFLETKDSPLELKAEELRIAAHAIGRITGRIDMEDVLGEIFSTFCIGK